MVIVPNEENVRKEHIGDTRKVFVVFGARRMRRMHRILTKDTRRICGSLNTDCTDDTDDYLPRISVGSVRSVVFL